MSNEIIINEIAGKSGSLGLITLNRPQALNALTRGMIVTILEHLDSWKEKSNIKAVLIQGAGDKAFCAGGDIRKVYEARHSSNTEKEDLFRDEYRLNQAIFHYPKPYIALLDGITMGGGVGVSIHGNFRIATERFLFAMPETGIGFYPDIGATYFLPRCRAYMGFYLGLTGARISAADAYDLNLIDTLITSEKIPDFIQKLSEAEWLDEPTQVVASVIKTMESTFEPSSLATQEENINRCFQYDTVEAIFDALKNSHGEWCTSVLNTLQSKSPTSLKVTLASLLRGKKLPFDACMKMEYDLTCHFLKNNDFYEGIRAVLVDKDQKPQWNPADLSQVTPEMVHGYFLPHKT